MAEKLRDSLHSPSATPEQKTSAPEVIQETRDVSEMVEGLDVARPSETQKEGPSEQWSGGKSGSTTAQDQGAQPPKDTRPMLPKTVPAMRSLVRKEIKNEISGLMKEVKKHSKGGGFSAHKLNQTFAKLRRLKDLLKQLMTFSMEKLKEVLFTIVPKSRYIDSDE